MGRIMRNTLSTGVVLLAAIQLVRPARTNPPIERHRTLEAVVGADHPALRVIDRSCRDCHSNATTSPWYSNVAPASWLVVRDVAKGREELNFSEWSSYRAEPQRKLLKKSCEEVREGEMPLGIYTLVHGTTRLTPADVEAVCSLAQMELARSAGPEHVTTLDPLD
jgi:hypothetical protein